MACVRVSHPPLIIKEAGRPPRPPAQPISPSPPQNPSSAQWRQTSGSTAPDNRCLPLSCPRGRAFQLRAATHNQKVPRERPRGPYPLETQVQETYRTPPSLLRPGSSPSLAPSVLHAADADIDRPITAPLPESIWPLCSIDLAGPESGRATGL